MSAYYILLLVTGMLLLGAGIVLLLRPGVIERMNLPLAQALPGLLTWIRVERFYYRHHRITGPVTLAGGILLCLVAYLLAGMDARGIPEMYLDAAVTVFFIFGTAIALLGVMVTLRPSTLKSLEAWANQPVTRDTLLTPWRGLRSLLSTLTLTRPRLTGAIIFLAGLALLLRTTLH